MGNRLSTWSSTVVEGLGFLTTVADFIIRQLVKTVRRPSRLIHIPINILIKNPINILIEILCRAARPVLRTDALLRLQARLLKKVDLQYCLIRADRFLQENRPVEAWKYFSLGLDEAKDHVYLRSASACLYIGLGRMREAIALQIRADEVRLKTGASRGVSQTNLLVLDGMWTAYIGHSAQIAHIVKLGILEGRHPQDTILYSPPELQVGNRFVIEQWAPHLRLVKSARDLPFDESAVEYLALNFFVPNVPGCARYYYWELAAQTHRRWHAQGRKPLLELPPDVDARGREALTSIGVPPDAWFVCLHVREEHSKTHQRGLHNVLNADLGDYMPAIDEITRRGGWVFRMGDPQMTALPAMPRAFDYCHSDIRSDWMDVFLSARCRFFIGTSSGLCYVPQNYGVPCVLTNWWPPAQRPWQPGDVFIPKLLRRIKTGDFLSLEQSLEEPFGYCNSIDYFREAYDVTVQDNHPEDIHAAVVEMFERLAGRAVYDGHDIAMCERAEDIYSSVAMRLYGSTGAFGSGSLARDFLRRHSALLTTRAARLDVHSPSESRK